MSIFVIFAVSGIDKRNWKSKNGTVGVKNSIPLENDWLRASKLFEDFTREKNARVAVGDGCLIFTSQRLGEKEVIELLKNIVKKGELK